MRPGPVRVVGDEEAVEVDPVRGHALAQLGDRPLALFGVAGEGPVVGVDPRLLVAAGLRTAGWPAAGWPPPRRRAAGGGRASGAGRVRGRSPRRAARSSSAGVACMTQRWTGAAGRAPPPRARPSSAAASDAGAGCAGGSTTTWSDRRAVAGGGEEGEPDAGRSPARASTMRSPSGASADVRDGQQLRLGQGRVVVGRARPRQQRRSAARSGRGQLVAGRPPPCPRASTAANVTRYREPVAKPRTAKGRARLTVGAPGGGLPGHAPRSCARWTSRTRSSCWRPPSCRRRAPTPGSTW